MKRPSDTSPQAQRVLDDVYRNFPAWRKWELLNEMFRFGRSLRESGIKLRKPLASPAEVRDAWVVSQWGNVPRRTLSEEDVVDEPMEIHRVVRDVVAAFNALGIEYALGGSLASSIHGVNRNTADADFAAEPFPGKEPQFAARFGSDYYLSLDAIRQAVRDRSTFNVINTVVGFKVDVFISKGRPFDRMVMQRKTPVVWPKAEDEPIDVVSAEDIVLLKLEWYRLGREISDQQWNDILVVMRTQSTGLDREYLARWARELGVEDLLERARLEVES